MNVLFICDGNVARSQEAELFFNALAGKQHHATSAGTDPKIGKPIDPMVVQAMSEIGYDMERSYRKAVDIEAAKQADIVVSFKPFEELPEPIARLGTVRYWNIPDPKGETIDFHRTVRGEVQARVAELLSEIDEK